MPGKQMMYKHLQPHNKTNINEGHTIKQMIQLENTFRVYK